MFPDSYCAGDGPPELPKLPLFSAADKHATQFPGKAALIDTKARRAFTYGELLAGTAKVKNLIFQALGVDNADIQEQRIAYLVPSGIDYVQIQWGIWAAGGVAVPLCTTHPFHELEYTITNSKPTLIFLHHDFSQHKSAFLSSFPSIKVLDVPLSHYDPEHPSFSVPSTSFYPAFSLSRRALIIYTSGTTSRPKGCVTTHANIDFQANSLVKAWKYSPHDYLLHVLPLHHVHGIINGLTATLLAGGTVELHPKFDPVVVWKRWMDGDSTMFMAVPTVYSRLNSYFLEHIAGTDDEQRARDSTRKLRLTVSGSAALPTSVKQKFEDITGQVLLERYGMTEIGMGLSCRYDNFDRLGRPDGSVGWPLDGVEVRLVQDSGYIIPFGSQGKVTAGTDDGSFTNTVLGSRTLRATRLSDDGENKTSFGLKDIDSGRAESTVVDSRLQSVENFTGPQTVERDVVLRGTGRNADNRGDETHTGLQSAEVSTRFDVKTSTTVSDSSTRTETSSPRFSESPFETELPTKVSNPEHPKGVFSAKIPMRISNPRQSEEDSTIESSIEAILTDPSMRAQNPYINNIQTTPEAQDTERSSTGTYISGEIQIRGPNVFREYWENPGATAKEFTEDGYFKTGDIAYRDEHGAYYIQGRSSVDIIKSGGYKISALEVEREILSNIPNVREAVVVGIPDEEWGERVAAVVVTEDGAEGIELKEFRDSLRSTLAPYKIPTLLKAVRDIQRNAMGKVNKKHLIHNLWPSP
ncbi:hypothetical protein TWF481_011545 [Arthrobotrys musiformis]|uniref:Uncharacterized protein n=1 Tax=Arthrobotrys musiformis TaxID=47236 RepID=A0AAV9VYV0_9PEZI